MNRRKRLQLAPARNLSRLPPVDDAADGGAEEQTLLRIYALLGGLRSDGESAAPIFSSCFSLPAPNRFFGTTN